MILYLHCDVQMTLGIDIVQQVHGFYTIVIMMAPKDLNSDMSPFPLLQSCEFWVVQWTVQVINLSPSSNETLLGSKLC